MIGNSGNAMQDLVKDNVMVYIFYKTMSSTHPTVSKFA